MKKEKLITRTMSITVATAMLVDITTQAVTTKSFDLIGRHTKESALMTLKQIVDTDTVKIVCVTDLSTVEEIRGMTEIDFYVHSKVITR